MKYVKHYSDEEKTSYVINISDIATNIILLCHENIVIACIEQHYVDTKSYMCERLNILPHEICQTLG